MKRIRHTPDQIISQPSEADAMLTAGASIGQVYRRLRATPGSDRETSRTEAAVSAQAARRANRVIPQ